MYMETNQTPQVDFQLGSESVSVNGENSEIFDPRDLEDDISIGMDAQNYQYINR